MEQEIKLIIGIAILWGAGLVVFFFFIIRRNMRLRKKEKEKKIAAGLEARTPADFKRGQVYQMAVASRSHVTVPYYVIVMNTGEDFIETGIPDHHNCMIKYPSPEWNYHIPRMKYIGSRPEHKLLTFKQKGLLIIPDGGTIDMRKRRYT